MQAGMKPKQSGKRELEYSTRCKSKESGKTKASEMQGHPAASESKKNNELQIENRSLQTASYRLYGAQQSSQKLYAHQQPNGLSQLYIYKYVCIFINARTYILCICMYIMHLNTYMHTNAHILTCDTNNQRPQEFLSGFLLKKVPLIQVEVFFLSDSLLITEYL